MTEQKLTNFDAESEPNTVERVIIEDFKLGAAELLAGTMPFFEDRTRVEVDTLGGKLDDNTGWALLDMDDKDKNSLYMLVSFSLQVGIPTVFYEIRVVGEKDKNATLPPTIKVGKQNTGQTSGKRAPFTKGDVSFVHAVAPLARQQVTSRLQP